jgi:hypothetical protein
VRKCHTRLISAGSRWRRTTSDRTCEQQPPAAIRSTQKFGFCGPEFCFAHLLDDRTLMINDLPTEVCSFPDARPAGHPRSLPQ